MGRFERDRLTEIQMLLERLDSAVVVRELGSVRSAEAFDGLRRQVAYAAKSRRTHVSHLLSLDESIRSGGSLELVRARVSEYLRELGVERLTDVSITEAFDISGDSTGEIDVIEPAIVEREDDGRQTVLRIGKARRTAKSSQLQVTETVEETLSPSVQDEPAKQVKGSDEIATPVRASSFRFLVVAPLVAGLLILVSLGVRSCNSDSDKPVAPATSVEAPLTTTTTQD